MYEKNFKSSPKMSDFTHYLEIFLYRGVEIGIYQITPPLRPLAGEGFCRLPSSSAILRSRGQEKRVFPICMTNGSYFRVPWCSERL